MMLKSHNRGPVCANNLDMPHVPDAAVLWTREPNDNHNYGDKQNKRQRPGHPKTVQEHVPPFDGRAF